MKVEESQYSIEEMIEIARDNINKTSTAINEGNYTGGQAGALVTIAMGMNIFARQIERKWKYEHPESDAGDHQAGD